MQTTQFSELVKQKRWSEIIAALRTLPSAEAAAMIEDLDHEQQRILFHELPLELAAVVLGHFPYYHQYVLLHARTHLDMRAILDEMPHDERMQFLDALPEEAWESLEEEIGELKRPPVSRVQTGIRPTATIPQRAMSPSIPELGLRRCQSCLQRHRWKEKRRLSRPSGWKNRFCKPTATMSRSLPHSICRFIQGLSWHYWERQVRGNQRCCGCFVE